MAHTYVFIRTDISYEQQIIQATHAGIEAGIRFGDPSDITNLVLIGVKDQDGLFEISRMLDENEIKHYIFHEPDFDMGYSALCTEPLNNKRNLFRKYKLYSFK